MSTEAQSIFSNLTKIIHVEEWLIEQEKEDGFLPKLISFTETSKTHTGVNTE